VILQRRYRPCKKKKKGQLAFLDGGSQKAETHLVTASGEHLVEGDYIEGGKRSSALPARKGRREEENALGLRFSNDVDENGFRPVTKRTRGGPPATVPR
jgi:hypothetical protein